MRRMLQAGDSFVRRAALNCGPLGLVLLGTVLTASPAFGRAPAGWTVLESTPARIRISIDVPQPRTTTIEGQERPWIALTIDGYNLAGDPGLPALPEAGAWIAVPPLGDVQLSARVVETSALPPGRIAPALTPSSVQPAPYGEPSLVERMVEGRGYASYRATTADVVRLGEPTWSRKQRIVSLLVRPVAYDAASERLDVARRIEITVTFAGGHKLAGQQAIAPEEGEPDPMILRTVLNPEFAAPWRSLSPRQRALRDGWLHLPSDGTAGAQGVQSPQSRQSPPGPLGATGARAAGDIRPLDPASLLSSEYRVRVSRTGPLRVHLGDLMALGFPTDVPRRKVRLYQRRYNAPGDGLFDAQAPAPLTADVPFFFLGLPDENGPALGTDEILFYGFDMRDDDVERTIAGQTFPRAVAERSDNWNNNNVYWIAAAEPDAQGWLRMSAATLPPASGAPQASYRRLDRLESDAFYQDNPADITQPRYHWTTNAVASAQISVELLHPAAGNTISLTWTLAARGLQAGPASGPPQVRATISQGTNSQLLDTSTVNSLTLIPFTGVVSSDAIGDGFATFQLTPAASGLVQAYLGSITLDYQALYRATRDEARFTGGQIGGQPSIVVPGFTASDLLLLEVTDPRAPIYIALQGGNILDPGDGSRSLSIQADQIAGLERAFWALRPARAPRARADEIERAQSPLLTSDTSVFLQGQAQALAIGPAQLAAAAQPWLQWRRDHDARGWKYAYVDVQSVFDQFSGGLKSPAGIKRFAEYAYLVWDARALLLVGDASEDARGLSGTAGADLLPAPLHRQVFDINEVLASDKWYGTFNTIDAGYPDNLDRGPDMAVGRLPADNDAELSTMIGKIIAYEQPQLGDDWRRRALWVADDTWSSSVLGGTQSSYCRRDGCPYNEGQFQCSQSTVAAWSDSLDATIQSTGFYLREYTDPMHPIGEQCGDRHIYRDRVIDEVVPLLVNRMNEGALIVSYEGHAAYNVLAHENLFESGNIPTLTNVGKPFIFFGMGCHESDFIDYREASQGRSLGELFVLHPTGGGIASYGSSGFEYLFQISRMMEEIGKVLFTQGRTSSQVFNGPWTLMSQWVIGEALAEGEQNIFPTSDTLQHDMVAQFNLIGDPLLRVDAAPPRLTVLHGGQPVTSGAQVTAPPGGQSFALQLRGVDETGVHSFVVRDSRGTDHSGLLVPDPGAGLDPRIKGATLDLPLVAYGGLLDALNPRGGRGYRVEVQAYDEAYPDVRPTTVQLFVPFTLAVRLDGTEVDEGSGPLPADHSVPIEVEFEAPITLTVGQTAVAISAAVIDTPVKIAVDLDGRHWRLTSQGRGDGSGQPQTLHLTLDTVTTDFALTQIAAREALAVGAHYPFPSPGNPDRTPIFFVAQTTVPVQWSKVTVYDLTGRAVAHVEGGDSAGGVEVAVRWNGRDDQGDELANGVYLYRLEVGAAVGLARSDMGRVVLMR